MKNFVNNSYKKNTVIFPAVKGIADIVNVM